MFWEEKRMLKLKKELEKKLMGKKGRKGKITEEEKRNDSIEMITPKTRAQRTHTPCCCKVNCFLPFQLAVEVVEKSGAGLLQLQVLLPRELAIQQAEEWSPKHLPTPSRR